MEKKHVIEHMAPWLGMLGAAAGWALSHQVGSLSAFDDCSEGVAVTLLACLVGLLIAAGGGWYSYDVWRQGEKESEGRRFLGLIGAFLAGLAAFAIILQALSALILPSCAA